MFQLLVYPVRRGLGLELHLLDLIDNTEVGGQIHTLVVRRGPGVAIDFAREFLEMDFDDGETHDLEVDRVGPHLLRQQIQESRGIGSQAQPRLRTAEPGYNPKFGLDVALDQRRNQFHKLRGRRPEFRMDFIGQMAPRPQYAVSGHAHAVGVLVLAADMDAVAEELRQAPDSFAVTSLDLRVGHTKASPLEMEPRQPERDGRHDQFTLGIPNHPPDLREASFCGRGFGEVRHGMGETPQPFYLQDLRSVKQCPRGAASPFQGLPLRNPPPNFRNPPQAGTPAGGQTGLHMKNTTLSRMNNPVLSLPLLACAALAASTVRLEGAEANPSTADLLRKIETLEGEVRTLRGQQKEMGARMEGSAADAPAIESFADSVKKELVIGGYAESKFRSRDGEERWDPHRLVIEPSYAFADWIQMHAEIEFEHGGAATDSGSKLFEGGNVEIEQLHVDFLFHEHLNWRAPGVDLVPVGFINLHHEPASFYSTERPPLYRELIPTTWFEMSTSLYGKVVDGLDWQVQVSAGLEDDADNSRTAGSRGGITAANGLRGARPAIGDFAQANDSFGYAARLSYNPPFLPGFSGSSSFYYADTTVERGNADNPNFGASTASDFKPRALGGTAVFIYDTEFRCRIPKTGLELRGEYVYVDLARPHNLVANNDGVFDNNVGTFMQGVSGEIAYHIPLMKREQDEAPVEIVPFFRFTRMDLQTAYAGGSDESDFDPEVSPESPDRVVIEAGVAWLPTPQLSLKADWRGEQFDGGTSRDTYQMAVGFQW